MNTSIDYEEVFNNLEKEQQVKNKKGEPEEQKEDQDNEYR